MFSEDFVIGGADQFSKQQDLKLSANADKAATGAECAEAPMRLDAFATQAQHRLAQQARVLALLLEPKLSQNAGFLGGISILGGIPGNERGRAAAVPKLKLLHGRKQFFDSFRLQTNGQFPLRFRTIPSIGKKVPIPFGRVEWLHKTFRNEVHFALQSETEKMKSPFK